jgi:hypothetical protein
MRMRVNVSDLDAVLGTILASVARARYLADLETTALAEQYRAHALLQSVAVPRVRIPQMEIALPLLINSHIENRTRTQQDPAAVAEAVVDPVREVAASFGGELTAGAQKRLVELVTTAVIETRASHEKLGGAPKEAIVQAIDKAVSTLFDEEAVLTSIGGDQARAAISNIRDRVNKAVEISSACTPQLDVSVATSEVKECASPDAITTLRIVLREEGLEWTATQATDGTVRRTLSPE